MLRNNLLNYNENLRVDKNFGHNITEFKNFTKSDEALIKSLILFMSLNFQKNLFGMVQIDPAEFSKTMKIDAANLFRKHEDPLFF